MIEVVDRLMAAVRSRLAYEKKVTTARTPVGEALRLGRGVCQDFAHLFLAACRGIGLPARYVSGYIHQPARSRPTPGARSGTAGAAGSTSTRPTARSPADDYIKIAIGRDYSDVPPNRGVWKGRAEETIAVSVKVEPIDRVPPDWGEWSTTQSPWSSGAWLQSQRQGHRGQAELAGRHTASSRGNSSRTSPRCPVVHRAGWSSRDRTRMLRKATGP